MLTEVIAVFGELLRWLLLAEHEFLLFAAFWFVISALDEAAIDVAWLWLRLNGHGVTPRIDRAFEQAPLLGRAAIFVPAWHENDVIGAMISHALEVWKQRDFTLFIGCYRNDPATVEAALAAAGSDPRVRIVINARGIM